MPWGGVRQLVDGSGEVTLARAYAPYGETRVSAGSGTSAYGYTGEWTDASGLVYLRARYYSPQEGRFLQKDTWKGDPHLPNTLHSYQYALNNPTLYTDPGGNISIHMQVIVRYAVRYNLTPEYTIPSTVPSTPPLWPGQRRGKHVDLADLINFQIWEVEEYHASGSYPTGHGPAQVEDYLNLLNAGEKKWFPGRFLGPESFSSDLYDVNAWWEQPGLIVYQKRLNQEKVLVTTAIMCLITLARLMQMLQEAQEGLRELPGELQPLPRNPVLPPIPGVAPPPVVPVPIIP